MPRMQEVRISSAKAVVFSFIMRRKGVVTKRIRRSLKRGEGGELGARRDGRADRLGEVLRTRRRDADSDTLVR